MTHSGRVAAATTLAGKSCWQHLRLERDAKLNDLRKRLAKEHFDRGEFREADAVLKAQLSLVNPAAADRTAEVLIIITYATFSVNIMQTESLYQGALKIRRSLSEANQEAFLQYVATTLNNLTVTIRAKTINPMNRT